MLVTFHAIFLKVKRSESRSAHRKLILTWNSHSRSYKVIHFAVSCRPRRGSISSYNTAGLISDVFEELATYIAKNCRRRHPHCHLSPRQELPRISACTLYFQKLESFVYIFVADSMGLTSFKFVQWAPKDAFFCVLAVQGRSGSFKVDDFGTNRKRVYDVDFLLVCHCEYGRILHHFWDTATYWLKITYFSYPSLIRRPRFLCSL